MCNTTVISDSFYKQNSMISKITYFYTQLWLIKIVKINVKLTEWFDEYNNNVHHNS